MNENPILRVAEIAISYHPAVKPSERLRITSSTDAEQVFRSIWELPIDLRESFYALYLDRGNKVLGYLLISVGGLSGTVIDPKTVYQTALKANASGIIIAHNHPSGNPQPSDADLQLTNKLKEAGQLLDINLLDHLIIMPEGYTSFADEGML
ncbi:MAG TPA: JAB domain-containing protein [Paludibacter sp.]|nr:JAB domain-containing protein [Paludibacter sp.]